MLTVWGRALPVGYFKDSGILWREFYPEFCSPASRRFPPKDLNLPVRVTDPRLRSGSLTMSPSRSWTPVEEALSRRGLCVLLFRLEERLRRVLSERMGFRGETHLLSRRQPEAGGGAGSRVLGRRAQPGPGTPRAAALPEVPRPFYGRELWTR